MTCVIVVCEFITFGFVLKVIHLCICFCALLVIFRSPQQPLGSAFPSSDLFLLLSQLKPSLPLSSSPALLLPLRRLFRVFEERADYWQWDHTAVQIECMLPGRF